MAIHAARRGGVEAWAAALRAGISRSCESLGTTDVRGVEVQRFRPSCPLLFTSGATPGPFYHSHPHIPAEFDHLSFDMASQVRYNIATLRAIGAAAASAPLPLAFSGSLAFLKKPLLLHWVSNNGDGFAANAATCAATTKLACAEGGLDAAETLGLFETGGNVSDRRFLLETFALFALEKEPLGEEAALVRVELKELFDSVDETGSVYRVGDQQCFMPYVPGYVACGPADLAVFTVTGAEAAPMGGSEQLEAAITKLLEALEGLGASFEDVLLLWNRVASLEEDEQAVLMARAARGLTRPLAEAVLEVTASDPNGVAPDGTPLAVEYIVVAQVPRCEA